MENTEQLIANLAQKATAVKPTAHPFRLSLRWLMASVVYLVLSLIIYGVRPDLPLKIHAPLFDLEIALLAGIVITTSLSAALLAFPDVYQKRYLVLVPAAMFILFAIVLVLAWQASTPLLSRPAHDMQCLIFIASFALLPAIWMLYSMRNVATTHPYFAGSIALLSAFSLGALSLRLSEQTDSIMHVIQWHYLPMMGVAIIGIGLGKIILRW